MIAALAAALLQPSAPPAPDPIYAQPSWPYGPAPRLPAPPPPPPGPARDIAIDSAYVLECRVVAEDGAAFQLQGKAEGRGAERRMIVASSRPELFPSGTAAAGQARTRNWVADDYVETFTLERKDDSYTMTLGWAAGRLTDVTLTRLRPAAAQPFGSPGSATCRRAD